MRRTKYDIEDLKAVARGDMPILKCAKKYNTSIRGIYNTMSRNGLTIRKVAVRIITPYKTFTASSIEEASNQLNCSTTTIKQALNGKRIAFMEREEIKVERINKYDDEEDI